MTIKQIISNCFTEADNSSYDVTIVMGVLSILVAFSFTAYEVWTSGKFDIVTFSTGVSALLVSTGGAARLKPQVRDV